MSENKFPTVRDLINKLNEFDPNLPVFGWNHSDYFECMLPINVANIHLSGEKSDDCFCYGLNDFNGPAVILNTT